MKPRAESRAINGETMPQADASDVALPGWHPMVVDWKPMSFEHVVDHVKRMCERWDDFPEGRALLSLVREAFDALRASGERSHLSCPPPAGDLDGSYRVTLADDLPVIERREESGAWVRCRIASERREDERTWNAAGAATR